METLTLNNGVEMPMIGFGTWALAGKQCEACVTAALEEGYRMIDTAEIYRKFILVKKRCKKRFGAMGHSWRRGRLSHRGSRGCLACQNTGTCVIKDDAASLLEHIRAADVLVFATPIYFYEMSGQMKVLLDRTDPLYPVEYAFRDIYLLATAAEAEESAVDGAVNSLNGWIACFEKARLAGVVRGVGADAPNTIQDNPALAQAYEMGQRV